MCVSCFSCVKCSKRVEIRFRIFFNIITIHYYYFADAKFNKIAKVVTDIDR